MQIEGRFYSEAKQLYQHIMGKEADEATRVTEEERTAECEKRREESERLYSVYRETARKSPQPQKAMESARFRQLAGKALWLAECCGMDIFAESRESGWGIIRLETAYFALLENADPALREAWMKLCRDADEMAISHKSETFLIEWWYTLRP